MASITSSAFGWLVNEKVFMQPNKIMGCLVSIVECALICVMNQKCRIISASGMDIKDSVVCHFRFKKAKCMGSDEFKYEQGYRMYQRKVRYRMYSTDMRFANRQNHWCECTSAC
jgi:hypothetical protein